MTSVKRGNSTFYQVFFGLMVLLVCLLEVFPAYYYAFNIGIVLTLLLYYIVSNQCIIKAQDVVVALFSLALIAFQLDVAKVSIFVFYLFLNIDGFYSKTSVKQYRNILLACFACVLIAYCFGFNQEYDRLSWSPAQGTLIEEKGLGFANPNRCMLYAFCISCLVIMQTEKPWHYILVALLNYVLFSLTQSRTFFYAFMAIIAVLLVLKLFRCEKRYSFIGKAMPFVYLSAFALSIILPYFFSGTVLNSLFTGRLANNKEFLDTGITLFGNSDLETLTFDSSYLHMLLTKGAVFFAVFSGLLIHKCRKAKISNKNAVILGAIFLTAFMEVIFLECNIMYLIGLALHTTEEEERSYD